MANTADDNGTTAALIAAVRNGSKEAESRLFTAVYGELRRLARGFLRRERSDHTLQATDLVHEAYIKLLGARVDFQDRGHFFRVAALAMRRILVDHARARASLKKGEGVRKISLDEAPHLAEMSSADSEYLLDVDDALSRLASLDQMQAQIVELRFFAGLTAEEAAAAVGRSSRTVKREWRLAQAWLKRELTRDPVV